jgi:hypothetical protein
MNQDAEGECGGDRGDPGQRSVPGSEFLPAGPPADKEEQHSIEHICCGVKQMLRFSVGSIAGQRLMNRLAGMVGALRTSDPLLERGSGQAKQAGQAYNRTNRNEHEVQE